MSAASRGLLLVLLLVAALTAWRGSAMWIDSLIFFPEQWVPAPPAGVEERWIEAGGRPRLHAWFAGAGESAPTLLWSHGNGGNIAGRADVLLALHARGLNVLAYDYRGYGKSVGAPSEAGVYEDVRSVYDSLRAGGVPAARIVCFGESLGGAVSIYFNVHTLATVSVESGIGTGSPKNTAFKVYDRGGFPIVEDQENAVETIKALVGPDEADVRVLMVNADVPGSTGGDPVPVGLYRGAWGCPEIFYRPTNFSLMYASDSLDPTELGSPNTETVVLAMYSMLSAIDSAEPEQDIVRVGNRRSRTFRVTPMVPTTPAHSLAVMFVAPGLVSTQHEILVAGPKSNQGGHVVPIGGPYSVGVAVKDNTPWVRKDPASMLSDARMWDLEVVCTSDCDGIGGSLPVHPLQVYFGLWSLAVGVFVIWFLPRKAYEGQVFLLYLFLAGVGKGLLESFRYGPLPHVQYAAFASAIGAGALLLVFGLPRREKRVL